MMKMIKKSILVLVIIALPVTADPTVDIPTVVNEDATNKPTIDKTFSQVAEILELAFGAMVSVKDDKSLEEYTAKLEKLAKEMLIIEAQVDMNQKPNDQQMRDLVVRFMNMNEKVERQMKEVGKLELSAEIIKARDEQFMKFLRKVDPVKRKTNRLFPPMKLSNLVDQIRKENAEGAEKTESP
jgi:hypothetical protein